MKVIHIILACNIITIDTSLSTLTAILISLHLLLPFKEHQDQTPLYLYKCDGPSHVDFTKRASKILKYSPKSIFQSPTTIFQNSRLPHEKRRASDEAYSMPSKRQKLFQQQASLSN